MSLRLAAVAVLMLAAIAVRAPAVLVFDTPVTFETIGNPEGWTANGPDEDGVAQSTAGLGANATGYLEMSFNATAPLSIESGSMVNSSAAVQDDYTQWPGQYVSLTFDLFVDDDVLAQTFFFHSAFDNSTWTIALNGTPGGWSSQTVDFTPSGSWSGGANFQQALTQVDLIGISVQHFNLTGDPVFYGLDNLEFRRGFATPEPGTLAMGATVLLSAAFGSRRRLRDLFGRRPASPAA